jgi:phage host-nuclease inhibitor protein Gam
VAQSQGRQRNHGYLNNTHEHFFMRLKTKPSTLNVPQSRAELDAVVRMTVEAQTRLEEAIAQRDRAMMAAGDPYAAGIATCEALIAGNMQGIEAWAQAHKAEFGDIKSLSVGGHTIGWRLGNWKTLLAARTKWDRVIASLQALIKGAERSNASETTMNRAMLAAQMLRTKIEPNKEVMIDGRENPEVQEILDEAGVTIVQDETFFLTPNREGQAEPTIKA